MAVCTGLTVSVGSRLVFGTPRLGNPTRDAANSERSVRAMAFREQSAATEASWYHLTFKERREDHLQSCTIRDEPWARSSVHQRPNSTVPITLHHPFLSFRLAPS